MTSSEMWDEHDAATYDDPTSTMFAPEVVGATVDFLARLAGDGAALELAIGTGRVGVPLVQRGVPVTGIELSPAMVARLRTKVDEAALPVAVGDMATTRVPGEFSLAYLVFNTISNLRTQAEQVECFRNAARHLAPGGRFVVELWVPPLRRLPVGQTAVPMLVEDDYLLVDTYDTVTQECASHHYRTQADGTVTVGVGRFRYCWPAELDLMAQLAGLELEERVADWSRAPFTADSESHVSVWRRP